MAEGGALLRRYTGLNPYRGFESLSLRQFLFPVRAVHELHRTVEYRQRNRFLAGQPGPQLLRRHAQISPERFLGSTDVARLS